VRRPGKMRRRVARGGGTNYEDVSNEPLDNSFVRYGLLIVVLRFSVAALSGNMLIPDLAIPNAVQMRDSASGTIRLRGSGLTYQ
jgi:hypothetical protein